ncbi:MAG: nucleoside diphosphate kinase regulator [Acidobacteria bacterium]|nr:MAG: nucleoside diphosphate kinase regulator [Acidobacteriota bacterium]
MKTDTRTIYVTESDKAKLEDLFDYVSNVWKRDQRYLDALRQELERAEVVAAADIPPDVITMNSQVRVRDLDSGDITVYTLVFPRDADFSRNRISILAPIGTALLGSRVRDIIEWKVPAGTRRLKVESVLYQPEAAEQESNSSGAHHRRSIYQAA